MKSFDEFFEENFEDGLSDPSKYILKFTFEAGQQSKQAEVDELRKNFNNALKTIEIQQRFLDDADGANKILASQVSELQKRIDEISNHVEINYDENRDDDSHSYWSGYNQALRELFEILKGDQL